MLGQVSFDTDPLEEAISQVWKDEFERSSNEDHDHYIKPIKSLHEGYGYAAERFTALAFEDKQIKSKISDLLGNLSRRDPGIVNGILDNIFMLSCLAAKEAIRLAVITQRISTEIDFDDLPPEAYGEDEDDESKITYEEAGDNPDED